MQLITLNTWGGRAGNEALRQFFRTYKDRVDVFCLQEIWSGPYEHLEGSPAGGKKIEHDEILVHGMQEISHILSNHAVLFHPHHLDNYGLMMAIRQDIPIQASGEVFVHKYKNYIPEGDIGKHARNIQHATIGCNNKSITIINFHGLWNGQGKTDSPDRIEQSKKILDFIRTIGGEVVLCGDFNLSPDTKSLKMFEEFGLRNLIAEYRIQSTRTSFYTKPEKFADYIFVSTGIRVNSCTVIEEEVSDHAAILLDIE